MAAAACLCGPAQASPCDDASHQHFVYDEATKACGCPGKATEGSFGVMVCEHQGPDVISAPARATTVPVDPPAPGTTIAAQEPAEGKLGDVDPALRSLKPLDAAALIGGNEEAEVSIFEVVHRKYQTREVARKLKPRPESVASSSFELTPR